MRILIKGYQYDVTKVKDILYGLDALENAEGWNIEVEELYEQRK